MSSGSAQAFLYEPAGVGEFYQLSTSTTASPGNGTSRNYTGISADGVLMVFDFRRLGSRTRRHEQHLGRVRRGSRAGCRERMAGCDIRPRGGGAPAEQAPQPL